MTKKYRTFSKNPHFLGRATQSAFGTHVASFGKASASLVSVHPNPKPFLLQSISTRLAQIIPEAFRNIVHE